MNQNKESVILNTCLDENYSFTVEHNLKELLELSIEHNLIALSRPLQRELFAKIEFESLKIKFIEKTKTALALHQEMLRLVDAFKNAKILMIPYKGSILSQFLYNNSSSRLSIDNDLLIPQNNFFDAIKLLEQLGYKLTSTSPSYASAREIEGAGGFNFVANQGYPLELHCHIAEGRFCGRMEASNLFSNVQVLTINGNKISYLNPSMLTLALIVHGAKHDWQRLIWLHDVYVLLSKYQGIVKPLLALAKNYNLLSPVYNCFEAIQSYYPQTYSNEVCREVKTTNGRNYNCYNAKVDKTKLHKLFSQLLCYRSWSERITFLRRLILLPVPLDFTSNRISLFTPLINKIKRNYSWPNCPSAILQPIIIICLALLIMRWKLQIALFNISRIPDFTSRSHNKVINFKLVTRIIALERYVEKVMPCKVTCLIRALATCQALRLFGQPATVKIGVKRSRSIDAHAWLKIGEKDYFRSAENYYELKSCGQGS